MPPLQAPGFQKKALTKAAVKHNPPVRVAARAAGDEKQGRPGRCQPPQRGPSEPPAGSLLRPAGSAPPSRPRGLLAPRLTVRAAGSPGRQAEQGQPARRRAAPSLPVTRPAGRHVTASFPAVPATARRGEAAPPAVRRPQRRGKREREGLGGGPEQTQTGVWLSQSKQDI